MEKERDYTLDVIRTVATFSVISVHFFLNNEFYDIPVIGERMYIMVLLRNFFIICVPLFLILTGYLMGRKQLNRNYYKGIIKTLSIYVLASISCIVYKQMSGTVSYNLKSALFAILDFSGANYSWYIEMYIGLFLLIPFLNVIFLNMDYKKRKILIITFLVLTSIPACVNIYNFDTIAWWMNPAMNNTYQKIIPSYWSGLWPITYYFIGCYLREYSLKFNWKTELFLIGSIVLISGTFNFYRSYNVAYLWGIWQGYNSIINVILATLVFHFILQLRFINELPGKIKWWIQIISDLTLGAYLVSYIFDSIFYKILISKVHEMPKD